MDQVKISLNVIIVVSTTNGANRIVQLMEKLVTSVVERITLNLCADPVRDQSASMEKGLITPRNVHIDVMYMNESVSR